MKENEITLKFINRIGINNFKDKNFVESIKQSIFYPQNNSTRSNNASSNPNFEPESDNPNSSDPKSSSKNDPHTNIKYNLKDELPLQVQLLEHLVFLRNESSVSKHDSALREDLKSRTLLVFVKNLINEFKKNSGWYSVLDDKPENDSEISFDGLDRLFALLLVSLRLEKYTKSESTVVQLLANNVLLSFRYSFQSETSNLSVVQHPEWAIDYLKECVKKYMAVFKKVKNDLKVDCSKYFNALLPQPYSEDYSLLEEFSLVCRECSVDEIVSSWCSIIAKEARLFSYSRLPFLFYDYFLENDANKLSLTALTKIISNPKDSTVLEVSRSTFSDDKLISIVYSLVSSMVEFGTYLKGYDAACCYELFSDFDNNTIVPFIIIQFYNYNRQLKSNSIGSEDLKYADYMGSDDNEAMNRSKNVADATQSHSDPNNRPLVETKILLCFDSNILYGCLDGLLEMENVHTMSICRRLISIESFSESIGVKSGLNTALYLQDDQFFSQVSNVLISVLKLVDRRCQCLKFVQSKKQYVALVVVPLIELFIDSVKQIWNSLDNVLDCCTISCLLLESATVLHEFLIKFPLAEYMPDAVGSLDAITQKMVGIFGQYFVELYYEPVLSVHRYPLEVIAQITHKLLQICALSSYKNYVKVLTTTLSDLEKLLISTLIPSKSMEYILMDEQDVEMCLNNCEYVLESVKQLVEPREFQDTMQQVQDAVVILSMETVELKTSAEYLNLLGTSRISNKNNTDKSSQESNTYEANKLNTGDSFVSSVIFDDFEGDYTDDIHDSLIVSKIKQKLKIKKLTLSQTYTLIQHILYATSSEDYPLDEAQHSF